MKLSCPECRHKFRLKKGCTRCGHQENIRHRYVYSKDYRKKQKKWVIIYLLSIPVLSAMAYVGFHVPGWGILAISCILFAPVLQFGFEALYKLVPGSAAISLTDNYLLENFLIRIKTKLRLDESVLTCSDPPEADDVLYYLVLKKKSICLDTDEFEDMLSLREILLQEVPFVHPKDWKELSKEKWGI